MSETTTRGPALLASIAAVVVLGGTFAGGVSVGRSTAPDQAMEPAAATSSPQDPGQAPQSGAPVPPPVPTQPAVYGNQGIALGVAKDLGHDSMSSACQAGITWTCDVTGITTAWEGNRTVTVGSDAVDADDVARKVFAKSPNSVTQVVVQHIPHGKTATTGTKLATLWRANL